MAMTATKIGVVYGTKSKIVRRVIIPDDDSELDNPLHVGNGETLEKIPMGPHDHGTISKLLGTNPDHNASRCAVVHPSGQVVKAIHADPEIDSVDNHPGFKNHVLILHREADVGWTYDHKTKKFSKS
jgi:hypothetical protein